MDSSSGSRFSPEQGKGGAPREDPDNSLAHLLLDVHQETEAEARRSVFVRQIEHILRGMQSQFVNNGQVYRVITLGELMVQIRGLEGYQADDHPFINLPPNIDDANNPVNWTLHGTLPARNYFPPRVVPGDPPIAPPQPSSFPASNPMGYIPVPAGFVPPPDATVIDMSVPLGRERGRGQPDSNTGYGRDQQANPQQPNNPNTGYPAGPRGRGDDRGRTWGAGRGQGRGGRGWSWGDGRGGGYGPGGSTDRGRGSGWN